MLIKTQTNKTNKQKNHEHFGCLLDLKNFQGPPFCHPLEKYVSSIFTGKFELFLEVSSPSSYKGQKLK